MNDIQRIRNIAQELADTGRSLVAGHTRCTEPYDGRENEHDAAHFEDTVHADTVYTWEERHTEQGEQQNDGQPEDTTDTYRLEVTGQQHTEREREHHAKESAEDIDRIANGPSHTDTFITRHIAHCKPNIDDTQHSHQHRQSLGRQTADEQSIADIANVFEEQRPTRTIQRKHFAIATHFVSSTRPSRDETASKQKRQYDTGSRSNGTIPLGTTTQQESNCTDDGTHDNHRMQTNQTTLEEIAQ